MINSLIDVTSDEHHGMSHLYHNHSYSLVDLTVSPAQGRGGLNQNSPWTQPDLPTSDGTQMDQLSEIWKYM